MHKTVFKNIIKGCSLLLTILFLLLTMNVTAYAVEEVNVIDLRLAKELVIKNSRSMKNMELTVEKAKFNEYIADNNYTEAKDDDARYTYNALRREYDELAEQLAAGDISVQSSMAALEKDISKAKEAMETESINIANFLDKYEEAQATYDDKERAKKDFEKQLEYQVEQLYTNILQTEAQIKLLQQTYDQKIISLNYERIKKEIGASGADIDELAVEASNVSKSIKYLQGKLKVLRREFNDLMGRGPEQSFQLVDFSVTVTYQIPTHDDLLSKLTNNYAKIPQLQRDIEKEKGDLNDANVEDDSNTQRLVEIGIEEKELALEEEKLKLNNMVSDLIAELDSKQETYQLAEISLNSAKNAFEREQKKFEIGVISKLQLMSSAIKYQEFINDRNLAGYEYSLARQAVALAELGIFIGS